MALIIHKKEEMDKSQEGKKKGAIMESVRIVRGISDVYVRYWTSTKDEL